MALVASGTKAGVEMLPWAVPRIPARAREAGSRAMIWRASTGPSYARAGVPPWRRGGGPIVLRMRGTTFVGALVMASLIHVAQNVGYPVIAALVLAESAGAPIPGETSLITGALLASQHKLSIVIVIAVAAGAAIVGDNIGYLIGRKGGRWLLERPGFLAAQRREVLEIGEPFFKRHGPKAVFLGRWILGLRTWASWLAGASNMRWPSFLLWNALGGIGWATTIGLLSYTLGSQAKSAFEDFGVFGLIAILVLIVGAYLLHRQHRERQRGEAVQEVAEGDGGRDGGVRTGEGREEDEPEAARAGSPTGPER